MKILAIPNWNGHLFLSEESDSSVGSIFDDVKFEHKEVVKVIKNNIEETNNSIFRSFKQAFDEGFVLSITGDHSNSYSLVKALFNVRDDFSYVIFDAHPDVEVGVDSVSHEDYVRHLVEENIIDAKDIYMFGLRTFSRTEFEYLEEKGIHYYTISDILKDKENIKEVLNSIRGDIYLSLDVDVLDPDHAPGTYYREWCGLYVEELLEFVEVIKPQVISADITEYYAPKDEEGVTKANVLKLVESFFEK